MRKKNTSIIAIISLIVAILGVIVIGNIRDKELNDEYVSDSIEKKNEALSKDTDKKDEEPIKPQLIENNIGIPVLYYHSVTDEATDDENEKELRVPVAKFKEQMKYLKDNNYYTLSMDEFYGYVKNGDKVPEKSVLITFDDGFKNNYDNAFPIMKEYGLKGSVFVITSMVDKVGLYMTSDEISAISKDGFIDVESHTVGHEKLSQISKEDTMKTLKDSKVFLEKYSGKKVDTIAYPFGIYDEATINSVKEAGYTMGFTTEMGWAKPKSDLYRIPRVYVNAKKDMNTFVDRLTNPNYK